MKTLRPYQIDAQNKILDFIENGSEKSMTIVAQMGSGKTLLMCATIPLLVEKGLRVWVVVDRQELADQWYSELQNFPQLEPYSYHVGHIRAGFKFNPQRRVQIVQAQTLARRLDKITEEFKPDVVVYDEAHSTAFLRVCTDLNHKFPTIKQVNLTATPCRHGSSNVQYEDVYPRNTWHQITTAGHMIADRVWKTPVWVTASQGLAENTAKRFSGMSIKGGDYDETSQAKVMIDLLPFHITEALPKLENRSTVWFCVNTQHALKLFDALHEKGLTVAFISGDEKITDCNVEIPSSSKDLRKNLIDAYRQGAIKHLITIATLTTGFDAPIASAAIWLRRTMSVSLFFQATGRVLRKHPDHTEATILDLAGNLGLHPFPEDVDWMDFNPSKKMFRDPSMVICKHCGHRHDSIPTPQHQGDKKIRFLVSVGAFEDGSTISFNSPLTCHRCGFSVFHDNERLNEYGSWLRAVGIAKALNKRVPKFDHENVGISIGIQDPGMNLLKIQDLYDAGIWKYSEGGEKDYRKDRSQEYREILENTYKRFEGRATKEQKLAAMPEKQRDYMLRTSVVDYAHINHPQKRYSAYFVYAYLNDKSPTWAYGSYYTPHLPHPDITEEMCKSALKNLDPDLARNWLEVWEEKHRQMQGQDNKRRMGICKKLQKYLDEILLEKIILC